MKIDIAETKLGRKEKYERDFKKTAATVEDTHIANRTERRLMMMGEEGEIRGQTDISQPDHSGS